MIKLKDLLYEKAERNYKDEYKKFQSSPKMRKYRSELNKYNRDKGTYGNGDGKDASHKNGKISGFEDQSKNRGRAEKSRLKKEASYAGNMGMMEMVHFYDVANMKEKKMLNQLMNSRKWKAAWALIQKVTKTKLVGQQFHEGLVVEAGSDPLDIQLRRQELRALRQIARQIARVARNME